MFPESNSPAMEKARNVLESKKKLIQKYEIGVKIAKIPVVYGKSASPISCILARTETLKEINAPKDLNVLTK